MWPTQLWPYDHEMALTQPFLLQNPIISSQMVSWRTAGHVEVVPTKCNAVSAFWLCLHLLEASKIVCWLLQAPLYLPILKLTSMRMLKRS